LPFQGSRRPLPQSYYAYPAQQKNGTGEHFPMPNPMPMSPPANLNPQQQPVSNQSINPDTQGSAVGSAIPLPVRSISMN
jgi:hypothetical protein